MTHSILLRRMAAVCRHGRAQALAAALLCVAAVAQAVPAKRGFITFTQPDGTTVKACQTGDERFHCYLTEDGYPLLVDGGAMVYARFTADRRIEPTAIAAHDTQARTEAERTFLSGFSAAEMPQRLKKAAGQAPRRAPQGPGLFPGTSFPSQGEQKALVVLVEYQDIKFKLDDPLDYFSRMLNEAGFSTNGGTGSARDFFESNSSGQFRPQFDVFGPLTLDKKMSYYGGNDSYGEDRHPEQMVIEACRQLDDSIDFAEYDRDGDGVIDNVFVFYAGRGEASYPDPNTVWPHSADIDDMQDEPTYFDGLRLNRYACSNEREASGPDGVGTFIHEFSHVMGLPDLYATDYSTGFTPGAWSPLDYGPYNNGGRTPPNYSAFERYALGWIEPKEFDRADSIALPTIQHNEAYMVRTDNDNEYYLIENRQQTDWDTYLPGHGMLVWHIDFDRTVWTYNQVNNDAYHQRVDLIEADGRQTEYTRAGDPFPGTANVRQLTDDTQPSMRSWSGAALNTPLTEIAETDSLITFNVFGGVVKPIDPVAMQPATDITPRGFTAHWEPSAEAADYQLTVSRIDGTQATALDNYDGLSTGLVTEYAVSGLEAGARYACQVRVIGRKTESPLSDTLTVSTPPMSFEYEIPVLAEPAGVSESGFTAEWQRVEGADDYLVSVYTKTDDVDSTAVEDFSDIAASEWTVKCQQLYNNHLYAGEAAPSMRYSTEEDYVESPQFGTDIISMSFWACRSSAVKVGSLYVHAFVKGRWAEVDSVMPTNRVGGQTVELTLPKGSRAVRITMRRQSQAGSLALDDVSLHLGQCEARHTLPAYNQASTAGRAKCKVEGLTPGTTYYYNVRAKKGALYSLESEERSVTTKVAASISAAETAALRITADSGRLTVSGCKAGQTVIVCTADGRILSRSTADARGCTPLPATARVAKSAASRGGAVYVVVD